MDESIPLFSVPVVKGRIVPSEYDEASTETMLSRIFLDRKLGEFDGESGLSTGPDEMRLHEKEELKWLMKPLTFAVKEYWVYTLGYKKMADIKCRDGWANKHFAGDTTVEHSHQDGWHGSCQISCVYYFRKPKGSSNIKFCNPNDYILRNQPYAMMKGIHTIATDFPANQYEYIIFPSWVRHRVEPSTVGPRIAMSFNFNGYE